MTTETTTTTEAATPTEGQDTSTPATETATAAESGSETQSTEASADNSTAAVDSKEEQAKPEGAPEKYEFVAPEGSEFSPEALAALSEVSKELDLPQEKAQKIIDKIAPALAEKQANAFKQIQSEWVEGMKSDKEFGGDKLDESLATAQKALKAFGSPELVSFLDGSGLGNHPELARMMIKVGKAISEDRLVTGNQSVSNGGDARSLYSKSNMNP